jgi:uncharacterized protein YndB with AHSA1/START domain
MKQATSEIDREIIISRVFDAPRELVFAAWTDPGHVERWWGPRGYTSSACEIDLRPGGIFGLEMRGPDGAIYPCKGVFREIVRPERIVYIAQTGHEHPCGAGLPPRSIVTITFAEQDGKTTLTIQTRLQSSADRDAAQNAGYVPGWESSLERLAQFLADV